MKITVDLDRRQIEVLASVIEAHLLVVGSRGRRGVGLAREALRAPPNEDSYDAAQLAPIYATLVKHAKSGPPATAMYGRAQIRWARRRRRRLLQLARSL